MTTFEAPRGTHDILPSEQPLWRLVRRGGAPLLALRLPADPDAGLRGHRALQRTSGAGSDIVHKEMYTFEDKGGRSLTLRPEATAPIARAYLEHGLHREPQPAKLYTIAPMYRYRRRSGAASASTGSSRSRRSVRRPGRRRRGDPALRRAPGALGITATSCAELDRRRDCRPAYLEQLTAWLDEHDDVLDDDARAKRATSPLRVFDIEERNSVQRRFAEAPKIGARSAQVRAHFARSTPTSTHYAVKFTSSRRRWSAASTTTRARPWSSSARRSSPRARSPGAAATTVSLEELGGGAVTRRSASAPA